ncbi:hypothetical protein JCM39068_26500 [Desulfocastanea catecholica]
MFEIVSRQMLWNVHFCHSISSYDYFGWSSVLLQELFELQLATSPFKTGKIGDNAVMVADMTR